MTTEEHPKQKELPELTLANLWGDVKAAVRFLTVDPAGNAATMMLLLCLESVACKIITGNVAYTNIDYTAYMEQVKLINAGERNYEHISGGTGALVYPAGHVWIYRALYWLTQDEKFLDVGQWFFGWLYVFTLALVFMVYYNLNTPPWVAILLCISKRLHSIYVLRLFNDCFTTYYVVLAVLSLQYAAKTKKSMKGLSGVLVNYIAPLFYSMAISVKMNALLYMPGFLMVAYLLNDEVLLSLLKPLTVIVLVQATLAYQFLFSGDIIRDAYFTGAFNFKRKFLYEWTVNWRFLSEETFLDDRFHQLLLLSQVALLVIFLFTKWASPKLTGKSLTQFITDGLQITKPTLSTSSIITHPTLGPRYITGILMASNFIGIICSRSLHYQFLSWYAWTFPYLLYTSGIHFVLAGVVALAHEWCWNVYPSTWISSALLLAINVSVLVGYWFSNVDVPAEVDQEKKEK